MIDNEVYVKEVFVRIDQIIESSNFIKEALENMQNYRINNEGEENIAEAHKMEAIGHIVVARETTNQKLISLLNDTLQKLLHY